MNEWAKCVIYTHSMACYPAFKGKKVVTHSAAWIKLEGIMLSEISQS
jgi:hypothetical protein